MSSNSSSSPASLDDKVAVVTGGASGFGLGIVTAFQTRGARVTIADINRDLGERMARELGVEFIHCDVSDDGSVKNLSASVPGVNILVNNAGVTHFPMPAEDVSEDEFDRVVRTNMKSVYLTSKHIIPKMKSAGGGVMLNIASTAGVSPRPNLSWYNASKGWLITATKSLAVELAADNIRVNAINPVAGETPLLATFLGGDTPENRDRFLKTIPRGRFSTPDDVANAACFLCSDEADMITGVALEVDGGRCI
jgi:3-oxoacyl-[acyl-carrier protein] reductase